jgi:hypothetical protein
MKTKFYILEKRAVLVIFISLLALCNVQAQVYKDTTNLIADLEAGIFEEIILAPESATDTFFLARQVNLNIDVTIKAKDGLGFKPVVTGNLQDDPSYLFSVAGIDGGAEIRLEGIRFLGSINDQKTVSNGTFKILSEDVDLYLTSCDFLDFPGYNAVAKVFNSGGDIVMDSVLVYNCAGKIVQVNYKDDDSTPNYVPLIGDLTVTNSSFIKVYKRIFFELGAGDVRIDPNDPELKQRFNAGAENITIDQCTFYGHEGVNVMQGRSKYEFAGDQAAIKNKLSITNSIFSNMDKNLNADSASFIVFDYNYIDGFGVGLDLDESLEDFSKYNPTNTIINDPVFADTTNGAWNLALQNKDDLTGSEGNPIGDPRWWNATNTAVQDLLENNSFAKVYSYRNIAIVETSVPHGAITVYDIMGRTVRQAKISSSRTEIRNLREGLYIIRVESNSNRMAKKVAIQ